jgi:hypothetical protein
MPVLGRSPGAVPAARHAAPDDDQVPVAGQPSLLLGEIRTTLLRNSTPISRETAQDVLRLTPDGRVSVASRPISYARSPHLVTGVHCLLASGQRRRVEAVGTILTSATIVGGSALQATAWTVVAPRDWDFRPPWSEFLAAPGLVWAPSKADRADLADGFLGSRTGTAELDLGAAAEGVLNDVQRHRDLDGRIGLRTQRTRLRFAIPLDNKDGPIRVDSVIFVLREDALRTISCTVSGRGTVPIVRCCEDVALHDWLLTTVSRLVEGGRAGGVSGDNLARRLGPAMTHLLPLWMPGAHVADELASVWNGLEQRAGFGRQWSSLSGQLRDQLYLSRSDLASRGSEGRSDRS